MLRTLRHDPQKKETFPGSLRKKYEISAENVSLLAAYRVRKFSHNLRSLEEGPKCVRPMRIQGQLFVH